MMEGVEGCHPRETGVQNGVDCAAMVDRILSREDLDIADIGRGIGNSVLVVVTGSLQGDRAFLEVVGRAFLGAVQAYPGVGQAFLGVGRALLLAGLLLVEGVGQILASLLVAEIEVLQEEGRN